MKLLRGEGKEKKKGGQRLENRKTPKMGNNDTNFR